MPSSDNGAVIWDVDGTLVDTAEMHFQAWAEICASLGRPFSRDDFAATFGQRNPEIFRHLFDARFGASELDELGFRKEELYRSAARKGVHLLPGVRALLEGLHAAGFRQAIGSSAPLANIKLILEITRSASLFDAISSADDTQRGKPDPQVFLVAAHKLGVAPGRCIVVEDAVAGVQAAKVGGMKCIAVRFVGHHPEDKLRGAGADLVVRTLEGVGVEAVRGLLG
ncbi:MAG: HAD family phosphatase [Planctomycetes bacterium]|nr:HAD family phosphatase [Planctomycetota bacterium]